MCTLCAIFINFADKRLVAVAESRHPDDPLEYVFKWAPTVSGVYTVETLFANEPAGKSPYSV